MFERKGSRAVNVDLDDHYAELLDDIKEYYSYRSDSQGVRKCIDDAHRIMQSRKLKDQEIFGTANNFIVKTNSGKEVKIQSEDLTPEEIKKLQDAIDSANQE